MTDLLNLLQEKSPLPLSTFMEIALYHPEWGYYAQKSPLGKDGDYITSPEICSVFGELLGLWCIDTWQKMNFPSPIHLVEFGPGNGIMMSDILRATSQVSDFHKNLSIHLIEQSSLLKHQQSIALQKHKNVFWHNSIEEIPDGFTLILANEFFDALPIEQHVYHQQKWHQRLLSVSPDHKCCFITGDALCLDIPFPEKEETTHETCSLGETIWHDICQRLTHQKGAALIIDYGDNITPWYGDTLQALYQHRKVGVTSHIGKADLTHHVDFSSLIKIAQHHNLFCPGIVPQGTFLKNLGIEHRVNYLIKKSSSQTSLSLAANRLISFREMGHLFKVLGVSSTSINFAGFS